MKYDIETNNKQQTITCDSNDEIVLHNIIQQPFPFLCTDSALSGEEK